MSVDLEKKYNCPPNPEPLPSETGMWMVELAKAMGLTACQTQTDNVEVDGKLIGWSNYLGPYYGTFEVQKTTQISVGCEQLMFLAKQYRTLQRSISCIINQSSQTIKDTTKGIQNISINSGGDYNIKCKNFIIDQNMSVKIIKSFNLSNNEITDIAKETKQFLKDTVNILQKSKSEFLAAPDAQKIIEPVLSQIEQTDYVKKVTDAVKNINVSIDNNQNINLYYGGNVNIEVEEKCIISQNFVLDFISDVLVQDIIKTDVKNLFSSVNEFNKNLNQDAVRLGPKEKENILVTIIRLIIIGAAVLGGISILFLIVKMIMQKKQSKVTKVAMRKYNK